METITRLYTTLENRILKVLQESGISSRRKSSRSTGLWLGPLVGLSALATILREDNSYSEICLLTGISGVGLVICCVCLVARLASSSEKTSLKDFHLLYFLPAIITSTLYLLIANKGLLVSVAWGLSVGTLGTWGVMQTMSHFPGCFTIGEATAVTHGIVLFLLTVFTNLPLRYHLPPIHNNDIATVILQVGILYVGSVCLLCAKLPALRKVTYFYAILVGTLMFVAIPVWHMLLDQSPLLWLLSFVFASTRRICLVVYWALCSLLGLSALMYQVSACKSASTSGRKIFHVLAVLVYLPGLMLEPVLLYLASGVVLAIFALLELLRICKVPPLDHFLHQAFSAFADEKDTLLSLTPLYLLCGLSFPLWMPTGNVQLLHLLSGVLTVGVGDACASYVGNRWGKHKWDKSEKSIEGTLSCIISQMALILLLAAFGWVNDCWILVKSIFTVMGVSMVEARTDQVDNLALPFLMYLCLML